MRLTGHLVNRIIHSYKICNNLRLLKRIEIKDNTISYESCFVVTLIKLQNFLIYMLLIINRINHNNDENLLYEKYIPKEISDIITGDLIQNIQDIILNILNIALGTMPAFLDKYRYNFKFK